MACLWLAVPTALARDSHRSGPHVSGAGNIGQIISGPSLMKHEAVLIPASDREPAQVADSWRRFWLLIALPGLAIGVTLIAGIVVYSTRARRRKLERGELPELP